MARHLVYDGPRLIMAVPKPEQMTGLLDVVAMQDNIVAATIVDICRTQPILLADVSTGAQCLADPACEVSMAVLWATTNS